MRKKRIAIDHFQTFVIPLRTAPGLTGILSDDKVKIRCPACMRIFGSPLLRPYRNGSCERALI
jgi:hypothetical protein